MNEICEYVLMSMIKYGQVIKVNPGQREVVSQPSENDQFSLKNMSPFLPRRYIPPTPELFFSLLFCG